MVLSEGECDPTGLAGVRSAQVKTDDVVLDACIDVTLGVWTTVVLWHLHLTLFGDPVHLWYLLKIVV